MRTLIGLVLRLAALGMLAALGGALCARSRMRSRGGPDDDTVALVGIFEGFEVASRATSFGGGSVLAWFGGGTLDLREATLAPDGAHLDVRALFGGVQVVVPDRWLVETNVMAVFGGVDDDRTHDTGQASGRPTITIDGWAAFGGVSISSEPRGPVGR